MTADYASWGSAMAFISIAIRYAIPLLAVLGILALASGVDLLTLPGFWLAAVCGSIFAAGALYRWSKQIVGPPEGTGGRDAAVVMALLLASIVSLKATEDVASFAGGAARALFVETPAMMDRERVQFEPVTAIIRCWQKERNCSTANLVSPPESLLQRGDRMSGGNDAPKVGAWILFLSTVVLVLLLARSIRQARDRYLNDAAENGSSARTIISYPAWISLCVYVAILAPAAYFSVGSLLYLDLDAPKNNLASISEALEQVDSSSSAQLPGVDLNTLALEERVKRELPATDKDFTPIIAAITVAREANQGVQTRRRAYKERALEYANDLRGRATATQFEDYRLLVVANYTRVLNETRLGARTCLIELSRLYDGLGEAAEPLPQTGSVAASGTEEALSVATVEQAAVEQQQAAEAIWRAPLRAAVKACDKNNLPSLPQAPKPLELQNDGQFPGSLYVWLAKSTPETVLIIGLIGFGLFGAAIRTMGRPDRAVVAPKGDSSKVALTSDTAKILVQGLGAAFSVFLGGQAGALILTTGGRTNAFGLLLFCFVGAVFAEEIWKAMEALLKKRVATSANEGARAAGTETSGQRSKPAPKVKGPT